MSKVFWLALVVAGGCYDYDALTQDTAPLGCPSTARLCESFESGSFEPTYWSKTLGTPPALVTDAADADLGLSQHVHSGGSALFVLAQPNPGTNLATSFLKGTPPIIGSTPTPIFIRAYVWIPLETSNVSLMSLQGLPELNPLTQTNTFFEGFRLQIDTQRKLVLESVNLNIPAPALSEAILSQQAIDEGVPRWTCLEWYLEQPQQIATPVSSMLWIDDQPVIWTKSGTSTATFLPLHQAPDHLEIGVYSPRPVQQAVWMDDIVIDTQRIHCRP